MWMDLIKSRMENLYHQYVDLSIARCVPHGVPCIDSLYEPARRRVQRLLLLRVMSLYGPSGVYLND